MSFHLLIYICGKERFSSLNLHWGWEVVGWWENMHVLKRDHTYLIWSSINSHLSLRLSLISKFDWVGSFDLLFNSSCLEFEFDKFNELIHFFSSYNKSATWAHSKIQTIQKKNCSFKFTILNQSWSWIHVSLVINLKLGPTLIGPAW